MLAAVSKDWTRIYAGNIKNRCPIEYLTFTKIIPNAKELEKVKAWKDPRTKTGEK